QNVTITDFSHAQGDKIDLSALPQFTSLASILVAATQNGADTVINTGSGSLTLENVSETGLTASDFQLPSASSNQASLTGSSANNFTAIFQGTSHQYTIGADGSAIIGGPTNTADSLTNVQRIQFV